MHGIQLKFKTTDFFSILSVDVDVARTAPIYTAMKGLLIEQAAL